MANSSGPGKGTTAGTVTVAEVERKFDVPDGFVLPDLRGLPGVAEVSGPVVQKLDATYFDTPDLRLVANRITLRRRTGGGDAGWHLKRPAVDGERSELQAPLGRATKTVPPALCAPVAVHLRGVAPVPVVRLTTTRTAHHLLDDAGDVLVEVAQDEAAAARPGAGGRTTVDSWSELEVELVHGNRKLLNAVVDLMVEAGATPSASPSKLARALRDRLPAPRPGRAERPEGIEKGSAGAVLHEHLAEHVARLKQQDPVVRADGPDGVHQMRVACRRLRSALSTFRPLVHREVTDPLRDELQWLGTALGDARDAEVTRDHLRELVEAQPPELVLGPVVRRITTSMDAKYRAAHDEALVDLDTPRYYALLDAVDRLVDDPPFTEAAAGKADDVLLPLVAKSYKRIRALVAEAEAKAETDPHRHDELLHEVRKAAKRARYAGEAVAPTYGKPAKDWAARMAGIQEALGEHQDTVVIREKLLALAEEAAAAGENTFTYGRLHGLEEKRAADTEHLFEGAWALAQVKDLHRWLKP
jgi:CHAD domain-containing protein